MKNKNSLLLVPMETNESVVKVQGDRELRHILFRNIEAQKYKQKG